MQHLRSNLEDRIYESCIVKDMFFVCSALGSWSLWQQGMTEAASGLELGHLLVFFSAFPMRVVPIFHHIFHGTVHLWFVIHYISFALCLVMSK